MSPKEDIDRNKDELGMGTHEAEDFCMYRYRNPSMHIWEPLSFPYLLRLLQTLSRVNNHEATEPLLPNTTHEK